MLTAPGASLIPGPNWREARSGRKPNDELKATRLGELQALVRLERAADVTHD
jgi:hypothetical protein